MVGWSNLLNAVATAVEPVVMPSIEKGYVPDFLVRFGVRRQCGHRLQLLKQAAGSPEEAAKQKEKFVSDLKSMPIAIQQQAANQQHYEVPSELYELVLGPRLKYSSGLWPSTNSTFAESEDAMLEVYCERAQLEDGQNVVDLGCGWGSLSLFIAAKYPNSSITSISNSASQREFIEKRCQELGLKNVRVITGDINIFDLPDAEKGKHDRVCSIEMFEHMKNYEKLMAKIAGWLKPGGKLFVHIFCHKEYAYHFEEADGWMAQYFFTGGTMPADDTLLYFQKDLKIEGHWRVNGTHYYRTSNAWLELTDANKEKLMPILTKTYGAGQELKWLNYWRLFFIATAEFFGYDEGREWGVSHYLFVKA